MSNYYGTARSNYVKVKDMEGLKTSIEPWDISMHSTAADPNTVCFLDTHPDGGGWPNWLMFYKAGLDEDGNECEVEDDVEFDVQKIIMPFLQPGEVLVMMEAGAEKYRYVSGHASAHHTDGRSTWLNLSSIYAQAAKEFGVDKAMITQAIY